MTEQIKQDDELITRSAAAKLLGVSATALYNYPIPFVQYMRKSHAKYKRSDVLAFKAKSRKQPIAKRCANCANPV